MANGRTRRRASSMAWEMQRRLVQLNAKWRAAGIEHPFKTRIEDQFRVLQRRKFRQ